MGRELSSIESDCRRLVLPDAEQEDERVPPGGAEFVASVGDGHGAEEDVLELADHDQRHEQRGEDQRCGRAQISRSDAWGLTTCSKEDSSVFQ